MAMPYKRATGGTQPCLPTRQARASGGIFYLAQDAALSADKAGLRQRGCIFYLARDTASRQRGGGI
jgi:hypothetical protein